MEHRFKLWLSVKSDTFVLIKPFWHSTVHVFILKLKTFQSRRVNYFIFDLLQNSKTRTYPGLIMTEETDFLFHINVHSYNLQEY